MDGQTQGPTTGSTTKALADLGFDVDTMPGFKGRINQYVCESCGHVTTTIDRDNGVTPFITVCTGTSPCTGTGPIRGRNGRGMSRSLGYGSGVDQSATPTHEWYRPEVLDGLGKQGCLAHVLNGGLLLREIAP